MPARLSSRTRLTAAVLAAPLLLAVSACAEGGEDTTEANDTTATGAEATGPSEGTTEATQPVGDDQAGGSPDATASIVDPEGTELGTAEFTDSDGVMSVAVEISDLTPGFHGLHIHNTGVCEPDSAAPDDPENTGDFLSAGSHLNPDDADHPDHAGDLPTLLVMEDGTATLTFDSDRLAMDQLDDDDGAAVVVHSDADNYANIPDRYAPDGPDADTTSAGDAGDRVACGVIEPN